MTTNAFLDAEELLNGDPGFWVFWTEEIFDREADVYAVRSGIYHWMTDVYVRVSAESKCAVITFGHPDESDWFYTTDPEILKPFGAVLTHLFALCGDIKKEIDSRA